MSLKKFTDAEIYDALISLGWLIPKTEREVALREKHIRETGEILPDFPAHLKDPKPLIERLRKEQQK